MNNSRSILGLPNKGQTCFLNACLQQLLNIEDLRIYVTNYHASECEKNAKCKSQKTKPTPAFCLCCALASLLNQSTKDDALTSICNNLPATLIRGEQNDAHECWHALVTGICESGGTDIIRKIFHGKINSKIQTKCCRGKSGREEEINDLQLEITDCDDLFDALAKFIRVEKLQGDNEYFCRNCRDKTEACKQLKVLKAPKYLTILLKRFETICIDGQFVQRKDDRKIEYPPVLDMTLFMKGKQNRPVLYRLQGVLIHSGGRTNTGHYVSLIENNRYWFECNDAKIDRQTWHHALGFQRSAYILSYKKIN